MFENVLGHTGLVGELEQTLASGRLPRAILLAGPRYAGKSTIALELARVLMCRHDGVWNCSCPSCASHRALIHPDLAMLGRRPIRHEIEASAAALLREPRLGTAYLFVRSLRRLTRRLDEAITPESVLKKVSSALTATNEAVESLEPSSDRSTPWEEMSGTQLAQAVEAATSASGKLLAALPSDWVPVERIRMLSAWSRVSPAGKHRVVVIEEAHLLLGSARNALLKLLEEPPTSTSFILTSTRPSAIIPTILSRLRRYSVPTRSAGVEAEVCRRIFRVDGEPQGLEAILRNATESQASVGEAQQRIARAIVDPVGSESTDATTVREVRALLHGGEARDRGEELLGEVASRLSRGLAEGSVSPRSAAYIAELIHECRQRIEMRNVQPASAVTDLLFRIRIASQEQSVVVR